MDTDPSPSTTQAAAATAAVATRENKEQDETEQVVIQLRDQIARLERANQGLQERENVRRERAEARQRDRRRQSVGIPSLLGYGTPATTALTDPSAALATPVRPIRRVGFTADALVDEVNMSEPETDGDAAVPVVSSAVVRTASEQELYNRQKRAVIEKAMRKIPAPEKFKGDTMDDKDKVETWCARVTRYLDGQFHGLSAEEVKAERMMHVLGLLDKPASTWMNAIYQEEQGHSWETLMPAFIAMVRDGRDTRAALLQQMKMLAYGKGKCRDLLSFNEQFETLRMKLYPTSSIDRAMSIRCGEDYGDALQRGNAMLYAETVRLLAMAGKFVGVNQQEGPDLSSWRRAAADAVRVLDIQRDALRASAFNGGGGQRGYQQQLRPSLHPTSVNTAATHTVNVNAVGAPGGDDRETGERQEGEQDSANGTQQQLHYAGLSAQRGGGGSATSGAEQRRPFQLSNEERAKLMAAGRCYRCYGKGHLAKDPSCPGRGKPRRRPTVEQLNA